MTLVEALLLGKVEALALVRKALSLIESLTLLGESRPLVRKDRWIGMLLWELHIIRLALLHGVSRMSETALVRKTLRLHWVIDRVSVRVSVPPPSRSAAIELITILRSGEALSGRREARIVHHFRMESMS